MSPVPKVYPRTFFRSPAREGAGLCPSTRARHPRKEQTSALPKQQVPPRFRESLIYSEPSAPPNRAAQVVTLRSGRSPSGIIPERSEMARNQPGAIAVGAGFVVSRVQPQASELFAVFFPSFLVRRVWIIECVFPGTRKSNWFFNHGGKAKGKTQDTMSLSRNTNNLKTGDEIY